MNNSGNVTSCSTTPTIVGISQGENKLLAVCFQRENGSLRILWAKSSKPGEMDFSTFAAECGLSSDSSGKIDSGEDKVIVAGFNSATAIFYHIPVPQASEEEIEAMVKLQAEARLPLPADQMELAWRSNGRGENGNIAVTVAAARRTHLQRFVENAGGINPAKMLLDCEGLIKAWSTFFSGADWVWRKAVVVKIGSQSTQVCLTESERLINAACLDVGMEDLSSGQPESEDRFIQDLTGVLKLFGFAEPCEVPVFVLSDGSNVIEGLVSCLNESGLNSRSILPDTKRLSGGCQAEAEEIYEYCVPIGLGLIGADQGSAELSLFANLYGKGEAQEKKRWWRSLRTTSIVAVVMLVLLAVTSYVVDVARLRGLNKHLQGTGGLTHSKVLMERQELIKAVKSQRPDLLGLLQKISSIKVDSVMLDSLNYKKGRPVVIRGQADNADQVYEFQKALIDKKGIAKVKIQNTTPKDKKLNFAMTFHYGQFTRKK